MMALRNAVKAETGVHVVPEESPIGESQSNGEVEGAVRMIQAQVRTMRLALQSRYDTVIGEDHPIVAWLVAEAADSINRFQIGADGKARRERVTGKRWLRKTADFGECVYYMKLKTNAHRIAQLALWLRSGPKCPPPGCQWNCLVSAMVTERPQMSASLMPIELLS